MIYGKVLFNLSSHLSSCKINPFITCFCFSYRTGETRLKIESEDEILPVTMNQYPKYNEKLYFFVIVCELFEMFIFCLVSFQITVV